jgi:DNA ligase (NAD+)
LYDLTYQNLIGVELDSDDEEDKRKRKLQDKTVTNIINGIEQSKSIPFERVLFALGIRMVGETVAKKLVKHFRDIDSLQQASIEELLTIHEIGERIADQIIQFFAVEKNREMIAKLKSAGLQFVSEQTDDLPISNKLQGKTFLVSGVFSISRDELKKMIESHGGRNVGSISKSLNYLIAGDKMGPEKLKKATDLKITIISEADFMSMIHPG